MSLGIKCVYASRCTYTSRPGRNEVIVLRQDRNGVGYAAVAAGGAAVAAAAATLWDFLEGVKRGRGYTARRGILR